MYTLHLNSDAGLGFRVRDRVPGAHLGTVFVHSPGAHSEKHSPMCLYIENALGQWHLRMSRISCQVPCGCGCVMPCTIISFLTIQHYQSETAATPSPPPCGPPAPRMPPCAAPAASSANSECLQECLTPPQDPGALLKTRGRGGFDPAPRPRRAFEDSGERGVLTPKTQARSQRRVNHDFKDSRPRGPLF